MRCFGNSFHSAALVLLYVNWVVDLCYIKSVWFDYYNPQNDIQIRTYRISILFTFLEMFILACAIVTVIKKKSGVLEWIVIMLTCNAFFAILTRAVYLHREEFRSEIESKIDLWNSHSSGVKLDFQTEFIVTFVTECLYCVGLVVLKVYSALTIHRYRNELESSHTFIDALLQENYPAPPPLPKPPGYGLWYPPPPAASELDLNDMEAPPPYSVVNER